MGHDRDGDWVCRDGYRNGPHEPSQNYNSRAGSLRIKEILFKLLRKVDAEDETLKGIKANISRINQKIESHLVGIEKLEQQFGQMST